MFHEDWYPESELRLITSLAEMSRGNPGLSLEIGCWEGRSTVALANALLPDVLYAIDTWEGNSAEGGNHPSVQYARDRDVYAEFMRNIDSLTRGNVSPRQTECMEYLRESGDRIKFCHLDGAHDYESVKSSLELLIPRLCPGGILCGHDYLEANVGRSDLQGGVERAARELLPQHHAHGNVWWYVAPGKATSVRIFDCFLFSDEFELLEIRLRELGELVDYFVLVEANRTFTGRPKLRKFSRFAHLFRSYSSKLIYVPLHDDIRSTIAWDREHFQRNAIERGLKDASLDDRIMISDVDEIVDAESVKATMWSEERVTFRMALHYYWLNCRLSIPWLGTVLMPKRLLRTPQLERDSRLANRCVHDGGWHFSYLGGPDRIRQKLISFSHAEYNRPPFNSPDWINSRLQESCDLFEREDAGFPPSFIDIGQDSRYSEAVRWGANRRPYLISSMFAVNS